MISLSLSIVSLPEMFEGCDEFGIRKEISRFFCPIATTMKSDGPAVFISSACMFVAQLELKTVPPTTVVVIWYVCLPDLKYPNDGLLIQTRSAAYFNAGCFGCSKNFAEISYILIGNYRLLTSVSVMAIPHIPSASILIAMTILNSAGVPTRSTVYLYAIDWLL